jgi:class 3 adenylate cyclase/tetratricopeptide (TPR) repeat protein
MRGDDGAVTVRCAICDTENLAPARFCSACGSSLGAQCLVCGAPSARGARYCTECGAPLEAGISAPAPSSTAGRFSPSGHAPAALGSKAPTAPVAERRQVTILFADLVDFTGFAEGSDPEEVRDLQARYFDVSREVILRYGGTVEKFVGDAVMALWGAPVAREDDAERAVRAAVELVDAIAALGGGFGVGGLAGRAGIVSGEAAVTLGAVGQGIVAGDVVNTAARLQAVARPGTVLVDEATYRMVRDAVLFVRAGDQILRGKRSPVPAWEARQVIAMRRGLERAQAPEAPLVGRESDLAMAKALLHGVRDDRTVRLLTILGPAGVGKSRIIWELKKYADGVVEAIAWHQARSPAFGEGIAFGPLAEMVRRRAKIADADRPQVGRRKLDACLTRFVPDAAERQWITPHLVALLGLGPAPTAERQEAFAAWRTFFERISDQSTTVLVFDDLQRADDGLLDFIDLVAEGTLSHPILLVAVARPELLDRRSAWGSGHGDHVVLHLEPLPRAAMASLLSGVAPGLTSEVSSRILDRAAGIPLYAVEILRMLVDRGDLEPQGGIYEVRSRLDELTVPATLQALISSRLDGLGPDDRAVLRDAAVLGQAFSVEAVAAVGATSVEAVEPRLRHLVRRELLVSEPPEASGQGTGRLRYRFGEWLVQEVAYATLARRDRRARHLAAGRYFEALEDPDAIGSVATHLLAAYTAAPDAVRDTELKAKAAGALRAAAERASAMHAPTRAFEYLEGALSVTNDDAQRAELWELAAASAQAAGRLREAEVLVRQAISFHQARGDRSAVARTTVRLGGILALRYAADESIAVVRAALDDLGGDLSLRDDPWLIELLSGLAHAYLLAGRTGDAIEWADQAIVGADRIGLPQVVAGAMTTKGDALIEDGRTVEGIELLRASLAMSTEQGLIVPALRARNGLAVGLLADDPRAALETAAEGLDIARRFGFGDSAIRLASNWLEGALDVGAWDGALDLVAELDRADLPETDRIDLRSVVALVLAWRGDPTSASRFMALDAAVAAGDDDLATATLLSRAAAAALAEGRPAESLAQASEATRLYRGSGLRTAVLWGVVPCCRAAIWVGDRDRAQRATEEIDASGVRGRWVTAFLATMRAGIDASGGDIHSGARRYAEAADAWRRLGVSLQLGLCQLEAAHLLRPGSPEARAAGEEARAIFEALGASTLLGRLEGRLDVAVSSEPARTYSVGSKSL